jgi:hypothetical protein
MRRPSWKQVAFAFTIEQKEAIGYFNFQGREGFIRMKCLLEAGQLKNAYSLSITNVSKTDLSFIGDLVELRRLSMKGSSTAKIDFSKLKKLRDLSISGSSLKDSANLEKLRRIKFLELHSPSSEDLARVGGLSKILRVYGPPLQWPTLQNPKKIKELTILFATKPTFDVSNIAALRNLRTLCFFRVSSHLVNCNNLSTLKIRYLDLSVKTMDSSEWVFWLPRLLSMTTSIKSKGTVFSDAQWERLELRRLIKT